MPADPRDDAAHTDPRDGSSDEPDAETGGWFFEPQSDEQAGLSYLGESPVTPPPPADPAPSTASPTADPAPPAAQESPASARTPSDFFVDDTGQSTAPFVPDWEPRATPAASASPARGGRATPAKVGAAGAAANATPAPAAAPRSPAPGPRSPGSPGKAGSSGGRDGATGRAVTLGVMVGVIVLFLAWYFLVRAPSDDPSRAVPIRSTAVATTPSATPKPSPTRTSRSARPTTARPTPTPTPTPTTTPTPTPTPTPSPTSSLNDAGNRLGWTFLIDGLGPVKLGLTAEQAVELGVMQAVPSACDAYSPTGQLGEVRVYSTGGTVNSIDIRSPSFPSGRGVRVGTPLANLQAIYGADLKPTVMTDAGGTINQWALTTDSQYIAYVVDGANLVERIAIGYRGGDGSITLPPPC